MKTAVITPCSHFFHAGCLKKWLYVQETCPLCHCQLKSPSQLQGLGPEQVQQPNPGAEQNVRPGDEAEPPGAEQKRANAEDNPSQSDGQDSLEGSADMEGFQGVDKGASPCEAGREAACAAELMAAPEGCPAPDLRVSIQL